MRRCEEDKMGTNERLHWVVSKFLSLFLTAPRPLPKSSTGDAGNGSLGSGMTDGARDAAVPLAAIQVHDGARAPPPCLIVQRSKPSPDLVTSLEYRSAVRMAPCP